MFLLIRYQGRKYFKLNHHLKNYDLRIIIIKRPFLETGSD